MTSRETETRCVGSHLSNKGSFKNPILVPNELKALFMSLFIRKLSKSCGMDVHGKKSNV